MRAVNIADLKNNLSRYLNEVRAGSEVVVKDRNKPIARIVPLTVEGDDEAELLELFADGSARRDACAACPCTDCAVNMMVGVAIAFLGTRGARADASVEQWTHREVVPVAGPRENPRRGVTDIAAELT